MQTPTILIIKMKLTADQFQRLQKESKGKLSRLVGSKTEGKYKNKSQYYNGNFYHSTGEANYARELDLRQKAADIKSWRRQVKIDLSVKGKHITNYFIDFEIAHSDGLIELVEYKGAVTKDWTQKWALLHALKDELYPNGVTITLVKHKSTYKPKSTWRNQSKQGNYILNYPSKTG